FSDFEDLRMGSQGPEEYLRPEYVISRNGEDVIVNNENPKIQKSTGYNQINLLQKIAFQPNDDWDLTLGAYYSATSDFPRYDRLTQYRNGTLRSAEWYYGPQKWFLANLVVEKKGNGVLYDKAKFIGAYQFFEESRNDRNFGSEIRFHTIEKVDAYSANLDFEKAFLKNKLFYGFEYILNLIDSRGSSSNINTNISESAASRYPDDSSWQSLALYSGFQWELNNRLHMQIGARYNTIILKARFEES